MKVSIIIPVYNAEDYLIECLDSILKQNYTDFELLLINDGSVDRSAVICDEYGGKDQRIKVFHQVNSGVSAARNKGIENAKGDWVTFIDADDYISENYFNVLERESTADLIIQGITYVKDGINIQQIRYHAEKLNFEKFLSKYCVYPDFSSCWSKFFKRAVLEMHDIFFDEQLSYGEDTLFNLKYLSYCQFILTTDTLNYNYRVLNTGLSNSEFHYKHDLGFYRKVNEQLEKFNDSEFYKKSIKTALTRLSFSIFNDKTLRRTERKKILKEIVETNYNVLLQIYTNPKIKIFLIIAHYTGSYNMLDFIMSKLNNK